MPCGEVLGLRRPHVARHYQAGPEQDRVSVTSSAYRDLAERGVDRAAFQGSFLAEKTFASVRARSTGLVLLPASGQGWWGAESGKCSLKKFGEVEGSVVLEHGADHLRADR
jgi:hypothetical protein